jgi:hypothetical protein
MGKTTEDGIRSALERLPTGSEAYDQAYKDAMKRIEEQDTDGEKLAKQVLLWIVCARRPLITGELQHALAVKIGESEFNAKRQPDIEDMVSVCAGLVTVDEESNIIRLVHYTTQEYFERTWTSWFPNAQTDITTICVTYLSFCVFESGFCQTDAKFKERLRLNQLYDYAAHNWGHHARVASADVRQLILDLLESEAKVSSSSQAMMVSGYSKGVPTQMTGLHLAAYFGLSEAMIALLKRGHEPDSKDSYDQTPLSLAEDGVDLNSKDRNDRTPLSYAAENGHEAVVKLLLAEDGVDLNSKDGYDKTPLSHAARNGHEAVVKLLSFIT